MARRYGKKGFRFQSEYTSIVCMDSVRQKMWTNYENASMILLSLKNNEIYGGSAHKTHRLYHHETCVCILMAFRMRGWNTLFRFVNSHSFRLTHNSFWFSRIQMKYIYLVASEPLAQTRSTRTCERFLCYTLTSTKWTFLFYYCNFYCGNFFRANDNNNKKRTEYWSTVMWAHFRDYNDDFDWFGLSAKHWKSSSYIRELIIVIVQLFRDKKKMSIPFSPLIKWDFCCIWADLLHQNRLNASMI